MTDKKKINQPNYTKPVKDSQSIIIDRKNNVDDTGYYGNSDVFPPRGSSINIPGDILFSNKSKSLDDIAKDKADNIGSDLYKDSQDTKE